MMADANWAYYCGHNTTNFAAWYNGDFTRCFEQSFIVCVAHAILAVVSVNQYANQKHWAVSGRIPHMIALHTRLFACLVLAILPLIILAVMALYLRHLLSVSDILTFTVKSLSFLLHSGLVRLLKRLYHIHIRGDWPTRIAYGLTWISSLVEFYSNTYDPQFNGVHSDVERISSYVTMCVHVIYVLSWIPSKRPCRWRYEAQVSASEQARLNSSLNSVGIHDNSVGRYGAIFSDNSISLDDLGEAENASCFSKLFFLWVKPLMVKGHQRLLFSTADLFSLPSRADTAMIARNFQVKVDRLVHLTRNHCYSAEDRQSKVNRITTLLSCLNSTFGLEYYSLGVLKLLSDTLEFVGPILLSCLVHFMEDSQEPMWHGYVYACCLMVAAFASAMLAAQFNYHVQVVALKIRTAIISMVYYKVTNVGSVPLGRFSAGQIVNYMSTDTDRIVNFCPSFHALWSLPIQLGISLYLLYRQVGLSFLVGIGFCFLLIPINHWIAMKIQTLSTKMMSKKDSRIKIMNEILFGIRVIKYYTWESYFRDRVQDIRKAEVSNLKGRKYLDAFCVYFWATTPALMALFTFATYVLLGNQLTAAKVFTSLALFNILTTPLNALPWVINGLMEARVSLKRLSSFMDTQQLNYRTHYNVYETSTISPIQSTEETTCAIEIYNGQFSWTNDVLQGDPGTFYRDEDGCYSTSGLDRAAKLNKNNTLHLTDIKLKVKKGSLFGVVGQVGSGKSSLLSAILSEMTLQDQEGALNINTLDLDKGFGYVSQQAWIQQATIRDNILFGKSMDHTRYRKTLHACALEEDIEKMPDRDKTKVGENGATLSGGQKARISLARAVYQDKDFYLLDDPFSAVDSEVANQLYERCIRGLLAKKTVILCTHHVKYLQQANHVILMKDGTIIKQGSATEVLSEFTDHLSRLPIAHHSDTEDDLDSITSQLSATDVPKRLATPDDSMSVEERATGSVDLYVYKQYWRAVGHCLAVAVVVSMVLMQGSRNMSDWWLSYWVTHTHTHPNSTITPHNNGDSTWNNMTEASDNVRLYLTIYGGISAANSLFTFIRAFLFAYGGITAAINIHNRLLSRILKGTTYMFAVTPIGRILNRFSSDLNSVDDTLPFTMNILFAQTFGLFGTLAITCYGLPWFLLVLAPLSVVYYFIQRYYRQTSREVKRLSSIALSPIYAHFTETLNGIATIRALRCTRRFIYDNLHLLDISQRAQYNTVVSGQWLNIWLQMLGVAMVTGVAFIAVMEHHFGSVNAGLVGLALSYALSVTSMLNGVVTSFTETEKEMVSVERTTYYIDNLDIEEDNAIINTPLMWPSNGCISFLDVLLRYPNQISNALNCVTFETRRSEKIGIVGRTGSGKSSLFQALFRMTELDGGKITIDGICINHLKLNELRRAMAVIPQDPFLFSGTVQENVDPLGTITEDVLWNVLYTCHLQDVVTNMGGLGADVGEKGCHFSVGQKQLVCLARALVTKAKILCIDEATASIDPITNMQIQDTLRHQFHESTVLNIAHRIDTVMEYDRVMVMSEGKVMEFGLPQVLLEDCNSMFYHLYHGQG